MGRLNSFRKRLIRQTTADLKDAMREGRRDPPEQGHPEVYEMLQARKRLRDHHRRD